MCSRRIVSGCAHILLTLILAAVFVSACDDTSVSVGSTRWSIKPGAMSLAVLVSDYLTYTFEKGTLDRYPLCDGCDDAGLPFTVRFRPPGDFGDITFRYTATGDTIFYGSIIWLGRGDIEYPREFMPASEFENAAALPDDPLSVEYFNIVPELDEELFKAQADSAWNRVKELDIVGEFAKGGYRVGIYLYAPAVGLFDPQAAKWIIFLHRQKPVPLP